MSRSSHVLVVGTVALALVQASLFAPPPAQATVTSSRTVATQPTRTASTAVRSSGNVIVKVRSWARTDAVALTHGSTASDPLGGMGSRRVGMIETPEGVSPEVYSAVLSVDPAVEWAEPDWIVEPLGTFTSSPGDPSFQDTGRWNYNDARYLNGKSWGVRQAGFDRTWPQLESDGDRVALNARSVSESVTIAVIDTGFYFGHSDAGANIVAGYDWFESYSQGVFTTDGDPTPAPWWYPGNSESTAAHGTCVAGEIAAATDNALGVAGATYDGSVRVYKVAGRWVEGDAAQGVAPGSVVIFNQAVVSAIYDAVDDGCKIINLSLGSPVFSNAEQDAINYAHAKGVLVFAASGNTGAAGVLYPAACENVIAVGAVGMTGFESTLARAPFSTTGDQLDLVAPGVMIWGLGRPNYDADGAGTVSEPGYTWWHGTSMASPLAAAAASVLWRLMPSLSADEVESYLTSTAADMGDAGWDPATGNGVIDLPAAVRKLCSEYPVLAAPQLTLPVASATPHVAVAWPAVAGYRVTYDVRVDGRTVASDTATREFEWELSEGAHSISVEARSPRNWSGPALSTAHSTVIVDSQAPGAPTALAFDQPMVTWTDAETTAHTHEYRLDGGVTQTTAAESIELPRTLAEGAHTLSVGIVDVAGNKGASRAIDVAWLAYPDAPALGSASVVTSGSEYRLDWPDVANAGLYEVSVNGATPSTVTTSEVSVAGLKSGMNRLAVRSVRDDLFSEWATVRVTSRVDALLTDRIAGADRYEVSYAISRSTYSSATTAIVVTGENWPDALSSGVLARALKAPVLLTRTKSLSPGARAEMARLGVTSVIIVGGEASVAPRVAQQLATASFAVRRIAGPDRYSTAALVAEELARVGGGAIADQTAFVTSGEQFPDALIASSVAARLGYPVLLTRGRFLPAATAQQLAGLAITRTIVVGAPSLVPDARLAEMPAAERISGTSACDTSARFAEWAIANLGSSAEKVYLASAGTTKYGDSLTGGPLVASQGGVLLFVPGELGQSAETFIRTHRDEVVFAHVLGGEASVLPSTISVLTSLR